MKISSLPSSFLCLIITIVFGASSCIIASQDEIVSNLAVSENDSKLDFSPERMELIGRRNINRANELIEKLYITNSEDFTEIFGNQDELPVFKETGTQSGYYAKEGTRKAEGPLVIYRRVWVYDASIALSLAVENEDPTADARALWLLKKAQYTRDPQKTDGPIFAGWNFSSNQSQFGDDWTDCRFMTGANIYGVRAIADYINSDSFKKIDLKTQIKFYELFANALPGIIYHMNLNGVNDNLVTAGWTLNVLEEFQKTDYSYNRLLGFLGYGPKPVSGYNGPIRRARAMNVVMEHNNNLLALLNYTLANYNRLFGNKRPYTYQELNGIRLKLRNSIFDKFYDTEKGCFITGRTDSGEPSPYTAIDNISWLTTSLKLKELTPEQFDAVLNSLLYTVKSFTKSFRIGSRKYFGAHYFEDGFEDKYIEKSDSHSESLHVEATCGLICGLVKFANTFPEHQHAPFFRATAKGLWKNLQHFLNDHGFVYSSGSLQDVSESMEASVSAIWYLRTVNFLKNARRL